MGYYLSEMTSEIIRKLGREIRKGITTEAQVVYLIVGIRKLLEQQRVGMQYEYLKFYCDWALHSKLEGRTAQKILEPFDAANLRIATRIETRHRHPQSRMQSTEFQK